MGNEKLPKKWILRESDVETLGESGIKEIAEKVGLSELTAKVLYLRGYKTAAEMTRFLRMEETSLYDPFLMKDMEKAARRILCAVENGERIAIYGDYDVDGVTSVALLYLYLVSLGADVVYDIPSRDKEGYGLSVGAIEKMREQNVCLIVTVDNGITANAEADFAKEAGMEMIVTDHHTCLDTLPNAYAVVNPHRPDDDYPFKELAGVGVAFKLVCGMEMLKCRKAGIPEISGVRTVCRNYADLAAIGTIADVMPIREENRLIVAMGLRCMESGSRPGIRALTEAAAAGKEIPQKITSSYVGYTLSPRMNAAGRMSSAKISAELLLAGDAQTAKSLAEELCRLNSQRKLEEDRIFADACRQIEEMAYEDREAVIVLEDDTWHPGVIGIVSSKITERYGLPSVLISYSGQTDGVPLGTDAGKGSGRSIKGLNLVEAFSACGGLLSRFGGHALAAGLSLCRANLPEFRRRINEYAKERLQKEDRVLSIEADCEVEAGELTLEVAKEFGRLEPFGAGNPVPAFLLRDVKLLSVVPMSGGKHLRLNLSKNGISLTATWFWNGIADLPIEPGGTADVIFQLEVNEFRGQTSLQLNLQDMRRAKSESDRTEAEKRRYEEISAGAFYRTEEKILPAREDVAAVYQFLRRESRLGRNAFAMTSLLETLKTPEGERFHYAKLKFILQILKELGLCTVEEPAEEHFLISVEFGAEKTSLENSALLHQLRLREKKGENVGGPLSGVPVGS